MPAVASWGLGLFFGFGLNALDVISFYYLFIPTWFFTIVVYTFLASRYGAKKKYVAQEKEEELRSLAIESFQKQQEKEQPHLIKDISMLSKSLKFLAITTLVITFGLACNVLFGSDLEIDYIKNRDLFYDYGLFVPSLTLHQHIGH